MEVTALGMIETIGLVSAIEAADAGLKAADVRLLGTDYVRGGLVMVRFEGDVAAVQAAVAAGSESAKRVGRVYSAHVIPRALPEVFCMLASDPSVGPSKRYQGGCVACGGCEGGRRELESLQAHPKEDPAGISVSEWKKRRVGELRAYVKTLADFPMEPSDIDAATKANLLAALEKMNKRQDFIQL